jgi:hypothetical protein
LAGEQRDNGLLVLDDVASTGKGKLVGALDGQDALRVMKNNEVPEGQSDNSKGDLDDETSGEDTLETDGGGEALEGTAILPKNEP